MLSSNSVLSGTTSFSFLRNELAPFRPRPYLLKATPNTPPPPPPPPPPEAPPSHGDRRNIPASSNLPLLHAQRLHASALKLGLDRESSLCENLLDLYSSSGDLRDALRLFDEMPHRTPRSWTRVASCFASRNRFDDALAYFSRMLREAGRRAGELRPHDPQLLAALLRASSGLGAAAQLHAKAVRCGLSTDPVVGNPLIDLYCKGGLLREAWSVFCELHARDRITFLAMISGLSRSGHEEEALALYLDMCRLGIAPTSYLFSTVLSACAKAGLFDVGKQVHGQAFVWGFHSQTYVCNALVSMYSRHGSMDSAEVVLRRIPCADAVSFNSLISAHAQGGSPNGAVRLFRAMQHVGLEPDCVSVASLLSACASLEATELGEQLHCYAIKSGMTLDTIIEGSLLDFYVNCADIGTAHELFSSTRKENVVLWNVMLMGYGRVGKLQESFELLCQMQAHGIAANEYTYPGVLRTCAAMGALGLGEQIHGLCIKSSLVASVYVSSVLIDMYCKCGRLKEGRDILGRLVEKDVVSWTAMIAGYAQNGFYMEGLRTFEEMLSHGIRPDNVGLSSGITACTGLQTLNPGLQILAQAIVLGYSGDLSIGNALVCLYARCGRLDEAYLAFRLITVADEGSWNGLISGFAQSGFSEEALKVFRDMIRAGTEANLFTYGSALCASANMADVKQGMQIHGRMVKTGYDCHEIEAGNALITLYSKCGSIEGAWMQFSTMTERNEVSWNAMITGYARYGCGEKALRLFEQMRQEALEPNHVTFLGVLSACSHVGMVTEGLNYFKAMEVDHGLLPRPEHYACMVDIFGRAGQLDRARRFIDEMPIPPDSMVWRTLLSACRVHKNIEIGEFAAHHLIELAPQDPPSYVLLSNIYALAKRWECRDRIRQLMKEKGVKKEPGRSWIEVRNSIHAFFVGDRLHPMAKDIYIMLDDLNQRAARLGYVQDKDSLLHDLDQEQKDPILYVHSERIAVAFGLISLSKAMPIRVIKNLRICNDCHIWMKYISTITERDFIVRDASRYHHFEGGVCSCRDYW